MSPSFVLQLALFICLVYNPFIFDYLVAARGYGLALGLLMWAIVGPAAWFLRDANDPPASLLAACAVSSTCIALSIAANFVFAFVGLVTMSLIFLVALKTRKVKLGVLLVSCSLPGAIVTLGLSAYAMLHMPKRRTVLRSEKCTRNLRLDRQGIVVPCAIRFS